MAKTKVVSSNHARADEAIPDYPIRSWVDANTRPFLTVTLRLDSGEYLSALDFDPSIRATGRTKEKAELAVVQLYERHARESNRRRPTPEFMAKMREWNDPSRMSPQERTIRAAEELEDEKLVEDFLRREREGKIRFTRLNPTEELRKLHARKRR